MSVAVLLEHAKAPASTHPCEMYRDHGSAQPCMTQGHHWFPVFLQNRVYGQIVDGTLVWLCGTCHDNIHAWLYFLLGERREPAPHPPPRAKAWAQEVFNWYIAEMGKKERP